MESPTVERQGLAIFDLDYTLTKRGTWGRFVLRNVRRKPHLWLPLLWTALTTQIQYKAGSKERIAVKQAMMAWSMRRQPKQKLKEVAREFAVNEVKSGLRPGAIAALEMHRQRGDTIMIASAAVDLIVAEIADLLGIKHYVATDMGWDHEDRLSKTFASKNCYGAEKLVRVKELLQKNPDLKQKHTIITMYSDSYSDLDIMRFADVGIAVNPDAKLMVLSKQHGFRVEDWMRDPKNGI